MRPTLRQMEYVVTIHRLGRFGLAAELLNVSQPSLSAQLAAIENELGVVLFERGRTGVRTTAKGEDFVKHAQKILSAVEDLRHKMQSTSPFDGRLKLGVLPSLAPYLLPRVVKRIHQKQPDLRIIVREESTKTLETGLKAGEFDAIISTPEDHPNTIQHSLFQEPFWIAAATDDPILAQDGPIDITQLTNRRLLTLDNGHRLAKIVYDLAAQVNATVSDDFEGTSLQSVLLMAATGAGIGIIPELFARQNMREREEICVRPINAPDIARRIAVLFRTGTPEHDGHQLLIECLRDSAAHLGLGLLRY
ncbi:MAG: hydrogen peroxide-inducible genes activator [Rhodobacteraceae bacterium]|jgi:LysR family hydrogen peroxide-inducible transcriptional activator|nr:hydrogen peroxide-inducible genes activator [Paracoccaceae bacterium]